MKRKINTNNNLPLCSNIAGNYRYVDYRNEFICLNHNQSANEKKIYNIRLGDNSNNIWINHKDYSNYQTTYTPMNNGILFDYNNNTYKIEIPKIDNSVVRCQKVSTVK